MLSVIAVLLQNVHLLSVHFTKFGREFWLLVWSLRFPRDNFLRKFGGCRRAVIIWGILRFPDLITSVFFISSQICLILFEGSTKLGSWSITSVIFSPLFCSLFGLLSPFRMVSLSSDFAHFWLSSMRDGGYRHSRRRSYSCL